ncbi:MAG: ribulose-phosphate 3-epimerase [Thermotogaceae bacterium]|jgi:ribulose-phosphate 3-epimerase|nr:ribulose-phosphate 3-epimerase [Thermotogaceae bacterium]
MIRIAPSILSADFLNLERSINTVLENADMLHIDVMDGHFVPNISIGLPIVKAIHSKFTIPLDVHLMITNPDNYIDDFAKAGANLLTVHYEVCNHLNRTINHIQSLGLKAYVSLNPHTPIHLLNDTVEYLDGVLVMSVNPGFGGQKFIDNSIRRIHELFKLKNRINPSMSIAVDGGINVDNAKKVIEAGADIIVAGSAIFKSNDPAKTIMQMKGQL